MHIVSIVHFEPPLEFAPPKGQVNPPPGYSIKTRWDINRYDLKSENVLLKDWIERTA